MPWDRRVHELFARSSYSSGGLPILAMIVAGVVGVAFLLEARDAFFSGASSLDPGGIPFEKTPQYGFIMLLVALLCFWGMVKFWKYRSSEIG